MDVILGIDTSCYTTSAALADVETHDCVKYRLEMLLPEKGERGLRQSTALFLHIKNLPSVTKELLEGGDYCIKGVCVSAAPRPLEGSYMPVFEAGCSVAECMANGLGVPLYRTTHQENHIMAASGGRIKDRFMALHLSGGTTEMLIAEPKTCGYGIDIISATGDISLGKLIDRVGVKMGLDFPCGKALEELALLADSGFVPPVKLYDGGVSLSGAEKQFMDAVGKEDDAVIARGLFEYAGRLLEKWVSHHVERANVKDVLFAGGVASNKIIKEKLLSSDKLKGVDLHFAQPQLCRDNAVGTAMIGTYFWEESKK